MGICVKSARQQHRHHTFRRARRQYMKARRLLLPGRAAGRNGPIRLFLGWLSAGKKAGLKSQKRDFHFWLLIYPPGPAPVRMKSRPVKHGLHRIESIDIIAASEYQYSNGRPIGRVSQRAFRVGSSTVRTGNGSRLLFLLFKLKRLGTCPTIPALCTFRRSGSPRLPHCLSASGPRADALRRPGDFVVNFES